MGWFAAHQSASLFQPPFGCRKNGSALPTGKLPAALQCHLMTSFPSEKIFYHGGTRIHTDGKAGSTMLDTNCANYRQLNSRLALIRTTIMQIFVFLAKNWPRENVRNAKKRSCVSGFFALQYVRIIVRREDFGVRWQSAAARSAGFQTCCVADFPVGRTSGSRTSSGFGNPRYSRLGSPRYFGCGYAALGSFAALICGCGVSRAGLIRINPWLKKTNVFDQGNQKQGEHLRVHTTISASPGRNWKRGRPRQAVEDNPSPGPPEWSRQRCGIPLPGQACGRRRSVDVERKTRGRKSFCSVCPPA